MVHKKNQDILISAIGRSIAREKISKERSIFEPRLKGTVSHDDTHVPTDAETAASLSSLLTWKGQNETEQNDYTDKSTSYSLSVQELLPTGGTVSLGTTFQDKANDQIEANYPEESDPQEYQTVFSAELKQPLLKGAWTGVTLAGINIAKTDLAIAQQAFRKKMMQVIYRAIDNFWNVYYAQEKLKIQKESVQLTQKMFKESKQKVQAGKMAQTGLLQLHSGIIKRKFKKSQAQQELKEAENQLRNLLSKTRLNSPDPIRVKGKSINFNLPLQFIELVRNAYNLRPEYISNTLKAKRLETQMVVAKNNRLPQLDLRASFQRNGLDVESDESFKQALQEEYNSWSVGLEFSIPLAGGIKSKSELAALKMQKHQALLKIKATEVAITNSIETSLKKVQNFRDQMHLNKQDKELMQQLLEVEIKKLHSGHSTTRKVLLREEELNSAKLSSIKSIVDYQKSLAQLTLAQGSLLKRFGLDVEEISNEL